MSDQQKSVRQCYGAAMTALRNQHQDEFYALLQAEYDKAGISVQRRLRGEALAKKRAEEALAKAEARKAKMEEKMRALTEQLQSLKDAADDAEADVA